MMTFPPQQQHINFPQPAYPADHLGWCAGQNSRQGLFAAIALSRTSSFAVVNPKGEAVCLQFARLDQQGLEINQGSQIKHRLIYGVHNVADKPHPYMGRYIGAIDIDPPDEIIAFVKARTGPHRGKEFWTTHPASDAPPHIDHFLRTVTTWVLTALMMGDPLPPGYTVAFQDNHDVLVSMPS